MSITATSGPASPVAEVPPPATPVLSAPLENTFAYTRSLGPVLSRFALGLRDGRIIGSRDSVGAVSVPPVEFDPVTGDPTTDLVDVASAGTVSTWSWNPEPTAAQPVAEPFAWALITLDGADTAMLHAVVVDSPDAMRTGMRVHAVWRAARTGRIDDIAYFAPGDTADPVPDNETEAPDDTDSTGPDGEPRAMITTPITTSITHSATAEESAYLEGLKAGKLIGGRIGSGVDAGRVYFPPRQVSPADGSPVTERVEVPDTGIVTTFCIVNVPFLGQQIPPPYVAAYVLLDGTDIPFLHLILDCPADEVRMGMRVQAVWRPRDEWVHSLRNISHFRPSGDPDAPYDSYRDHL